ncbi:MAG: phosphatidylglycerol lysyltransferase domain-containing protein [Eubacteriales bacterium]
MNIEFKHPAVSDRDWMEPYFRASGCRGSECSFTNLMLWGKGYGEIAVIGDFLVQFLKIDGVKYYAFPAGNPKGDLKFVVDVLLEDAKHYDHPLRFVGLTCGRKQLLMDTCPEAFQYDTNRNAYDYLYDINRLADLGGKKLQSKRNHCNRFQQNHPDWFTTPITPENLNLCREFAQDWFAKNEGGETSQEHDFRVEKIAIGRAFDHFLDLGFEGLILFAGGAPVAFTMGNPITDDTFDVNFEKAVGEIQGAYPMINREFSRHIRGKYPNIKFLNREDDMGLPGLRKSKESYYPDELLVKHTAIFVGS